jgi:hypothetical protein
VAGSKGGVGSINLFGIIKEVDADPSGVIKFSEKYFNGNEIFIDQEKLFYKELGSQKLSIPSWNPITLYKQYQALKERMKLKKIGGNLVGEGILKGGLFVISPTEGVVFRHQEETGTPMPYAEIEQVVAKLLHEGGISTSGGNMSSNNVK